MTAMNDASDNAKDLIGDLSYNKARQKQQSLEILEVVGVLGHSQLNSFILAS